MGQAGNMGVIKVAGSVCRRDQGDWGGRQDLWEQSGWQKSSMEGLGGTRVQVAFAEVAVLEAGIFRRDWGEQGCKWCPQEDWGAIRIYRGTGKIEVAGGI